MKTKLLNVLTAVILSVSFTGFANADVTFDFPTGVLFSESNPTQQVGTFTLTSGGTSLTGTSPIQAFQIAGTTNIAIQGNGGDFNSDPTISLQVNLTDPAFSIQSFNIASTETVNGQPPAALGFNIGNGGGANAADLGLSFNVDGIFTTPNAGLGEFVFDSVNSDILADGALVAGQIAAADTLTSGNHADDTFLFVPDSPITSGAPFEVTVTSFDNNTIAGEAFRFDLNIVAAAAAAVPEPSSLAILGLGGIAFLVRRKR